MGKKSHNQRGSKGGGGGKRNDKGNKRGENRKALDRKALASFSGVLHSQGFSLKEVGRDGNCFFRSLADQCEDNEHNYDDYRQRICEQ